MAEFVGGGGARGPGVVDGAGEGVFGAAVGGGGDGEGEGHFGGLTLLVLWESEVSGVVVGGLCW